MRKDVADEKYERVKDYIDRYSYIDLILWRNEMITTGNINNRLYRLIDSEIAKRKEDINSQEEKSKGK